MKKLILMMIAGLFSLGANAMHLFVGCNGSGFVWIVSTDDNYGNVQIYSSSVPCNVHACVQVFKVPVSVAPDGSGTDHNLESTLNQLSPLSFRKPASDQELADANHIVSSWDGSAHTFINTSVLNADILTFIGGK